MFIMDKMGAKLPFLNLHSCRDKQRIEKGYSWFKDNIADPVPFLPDPDQT